jgi:transposase
LQAKSAWARIVQKVYEVDPLVCPKCGSAMKVIAVITKPEEIRRIMEYQRRNKAPPFDAAWPEAS